MRAGITGPSTYTSVRFASDCLIKANNKWLNVRFWHKADMPSCAAHVRFWSKSGHDVSHCKCLLLTQSGHRLTQATPPFSLPVWPCTMPCSEPRGSSMRRREFLGLVGAATIWPVFAHGQQTPVPVIGFLSSRSPDEFEASAGRIPSGFGRDRVYRGEKRKRRISMGTWRLWQIASVGG